MAYCRKSGNGSDYAIEGANNSVESKAIAGSNITVMNTDDDTAGLVIKSKLSGLVDSATTGANRAFCKGITTTDELCKGQCGLDAKKCSRKFTVQELAKKNSQISETGSLDHVALVEEGGFTEQYTVALSSQPSKTVTVKLDVPKTSMTYQTGTDCSATTKTDTKFQQVEFGTPAFLNFWDQFVLHIVFCIV